MITLTVPTRLLRRVEASTYLLETHGVRRAVSTLAKLACVGGGPRFRIAGRTPLYAPDDLDAYAESILSPLVSNTSELREHRARRGHADDELSTTHEIEEFRP